MHTECLKTWIVAKFENILESRCEICQYKYKMELCFQNRFMIALACKQGRHFCITLLLLMVVMTGLVTILAIFGMRM